MIGAKPIAQPSNFGLRNCSNLSVFGEGQCIFNVDAEITHSAFNFCYDPAKFAPRAGFPFVCTSKPP
jgi:hypothetical protein